MTSTKQTIERIRERLNRNDMWGYSTLADARLAIRDLIRLAYVLADEECERAAQVCEAHLETFAYGESVRDVIQSIAHDIRSGWGREGSTELPETRPPKPRGEEG